jgi:hypothetical protein
MSESEVHGERGSEASPGAATRARRAPTGRRKVSKPRAAVTRKSPSGNGRRKTASPRSASKGKGDLEGLVATLAKKASSARNRLAAASGDGAAATRRAWQRISGTSRKAIGRLAGEWKQMDPATKAQVLAALLTTLAAASAPLVRKSLRKR